MPSSHQSASPQTASPAPSRSISIRVPEGYTWFVIDDPPNGVDELLYTELAWEDPEAKYTDRYQKGEWDGTHRLYNRDHHMAPIGLLEQATDLLESQGYTVSVDYEAPKAGADINTDWAFDGSLRDYQHDAVTAVLEAGGGIVSLPTGAGKTLVALNLINCIEQQTIVFVHTTKLLYQWAERIRDVLGVDPGIIGDGEWSEGPITVATMQTLHSRGLDSLTGQYGIACFDECHRTSAAETMQDIGLDIDVEWRVGLSATPWRRAPGEAIEIEAAVGPEAISISAEQLIDNGYLAEPEFEFLDVDGQQIPDSDDDYQTIYKQCIELDPARNEAIATKAASLAQDGHTVFVSVNRLNQGHLIQYALGELEQQMATNTLCEPDDDPGERDAKLNAISGINRVDADVSAAFLHSTATTSQRGAVFEEFQNGDLDILVSTLLREGADIPEISALIQAGGQKSDIQQIQRAGRALRPTNGDTATIVDIRDEGVHIGGHFKARRATYARYYGQYGPNLYTECERAVRQYLSNHDIDPLSLTVAERGQYVVVEADGYLENYSQFVELMLSNENVEYENGTNYIHKGWVNRALL